MASERGGFRKERILLVALAVLLVMSVSYIAYSEYTRSAIQIAQEGFLTGYRQGVMDGVVDTVGKIYTETAACQPVPVMYENTTKYIIDVDCLNSP